MLDTARSLAPDLRVYGENGLISEFVFQVPPKQAGGNDATVKNGARERTNERAEMAHDATRLRRPPGPHFRQISDVKNRVRTPVERCFGTRQDHEWRQMASSLDFKIACQLEINSDFDR